MRTIPSAPDSAEAKGAPFEPRPSSEVEPSQSTSASDSTETKGAPLEPMSIAGLEPSDSSWDQQLVHAAMTHFAELEAGIPRDVRKDILQLSEEFCAAISHVAEKKRQADTRRRASRRSSLLSRRRATVSDEIAHDLAQMRPMTESAQPDSGRKVRFLPPAREVFIWTCVTMLGTIVYSVVFSGLGLLFLWLLYATLESVSLYDHSTGLMRNASSTVGTNHSSSGLDQDWAFERNRRSVYVCVIGWALTGQLVNSIVTIWSRRARTSRFSLTSFITAVVVPTWWPILMYFLLLVVIYEGGTGAILLDGKVVATITVVIATLQSLSGAYLSYFEYQKDEIVVAREEARVAIGQTSRKKRNHRVAALLRALRVCLPFLMTYAFAGLFVIVILSLYREAKSTSLKMLVYLVGLAIKVVGNKLQLHLIHKSPSSPTWLVDTAVYLYEYGIALLCRLMLLAIPDEQTALILSILNCVFELMVRTWCFVDYMGEHSATVQHLYHSKSVTARLSQDEGGSDAGSKTRRKGYTSESEFWRWGILRVTDGLNDQVVEYVTSIIAAGILFWLPATGAFNVTATSNEATDLVTLLRLVSYQAIPEVIVDAYASALEIRGGLSSQYAQYWKSQRSDKSAILKALFTVSALAFCLSVAIVVK